MELVCEDVRSVAGLAQVLGAMTQEIRSTMAGNLSLAQIVTRLGGRNTELCPRSKEPISCLKKCIRLAQFIRWLT